MRSDDEAVDDHLLSLVAAAEASALASKRRRISPFSTPARASASGDVEGAGGGVGTATEEGSYTAALRGSRSALWQQQQQKQLQQGKREDFKSVDGGYAAGVSASGARAVGSCFKCGQPGHWARDCAGGGGGYMEPVRDRAVDGGLGTEGDLIAKACPCGLGNCLVLTSNTARNPGRKFYRCPVKVENGGCNFFEWCEAVPAPRNFSNNSSSVPELSCPCGAGSCLVLTAKTGKNVGQQFYRCPLDQGAGSCGFFKWCNQYKSSTDPLATESGCSPTPNSTNPQFAGGRSALSCFRCGHDGHWAKDCPKHESDAHASTRGNNSASSGSCFKCGQVGHWARDCPAQNNTSSAGRKD